MSGPYFESWDAWTLGKFARTLNEKRKSDEELMQQALEALDAYSWEQVQAATTALRERLAQEEAQCVAGESKLEVVPAKGSLQPAREEPEPVVWMYQDKSTHEVRFQKHMREFVDHGATYETPLYTAPQVTPQVTPQRTWVGLPGAGHTEQGAKPMNQCPKCGKVSGLHSSILPGCMCEWSMQAMKEGKDFTISKPWVGLTATEVHETEGYEEDRKLYRFARAIEAKLKEKNQ